MSEYVMLCPKCDGEMELGHINDFAHAAILTSTWTSGIPQKSWLTGTKAPKPADQIPVGTFRCHSCGFLESYARSEFRPQ